MSATQTSELNLTTERKGHSSLSPVSFLEGWTRDHAILHSWDEKYYLDVSIIRCYVCRGWKNHDVFEARIGGRYVRQLKREFATADEAKLACQNLAIKACKEMLAMLNAKPSNVPKLSHGHGGKAKDVK